MSVHRVYSDKQHQYIPDFTRQSFSRLRLMSHDLKIETGSWSRIPRDMRKCHCDGESVQTESHVLVECTLIRQLRIKYGFEDIHCIADLFHEHLDASKVCKYVYEALNILRDI